MIRRAAIALLALAAAPVLAEESAGYGQAFVDTFAQACVPERLSYRGTKANAEKLGWTRAERSAHPELDTMMTKLDASVEEAARDLQATFDLQIYEKPVAGMRHFLVVGRSTFIVEGFGDDDEEPDPWVFLGCHLYNFDASAPIDPAPVTALIENPVSREIDDQGMIGYVWGPPCPMPRTGDTYMSFIGDESPHIELTGFSGLTMKFDTSEPDPGEVVPETYCSDETLSAAS